MAKVRSTASAFLVSLVILGLAFAGATALAIVFYAQGEKSLHDKEIAEANLIATKLPGDDSKPAVIKALSARSDGGNKDSLVGILADQNADLAKQVEKLTKDDLASKQRDLDAATAELSRLKSDNTRLKAESEAIRTSAAATVKGATEAAEQARSAAKDTDEQSRTKIETANAAVKDAQDRFNQALEEQQRLLEAKDQATAAQAAKVARLAAEKDELVRKIRAEHQPVANDVATPVGKITDVLPNGDVVLNLGSTKRVRPGLTFEVFPSNSVIHMQAGNIVSGKATIEVYNTQATDSVARMVRGSKNVHLGKGDVLVNLAFHPTNETNFVVYGMFDINHTGNPNGVVEDESRIKALITAAGGKVFDLDTTKKQIDLAPDVDYLVLGKEPVAPEALSDAEATDVARVEAFKRAQRNYELYSSLVAQAKQMQVPVLNQNRFMELIGFYHRNKTSATKN